VSKSQDSDDFDRMITDIQSRYLSADREYVLASLKSAIDRIEETFSRFGHFVMEFIQNADDAGAHNLRIELYEDRVVILNDGNPFSPEDVSSLCRVGISSKRSADYIGYLGVGFKSVFIISDRVRVSSGNRAFAFDHAAAEERWGSGVPWQVIPIPAIPLSEIGASYTTGFQISLSPLLGGGHDRLVRETRPEELRGRILLFLRNLDSIEILDHSQPTNNLIRHNRRLVDSGDSSQVWELEGVTGGMAPSVVRFLVFRRKVPIPDDVRRDEMTLRSGRGEAQSREVVVAFRLGEKGELLAEPMGTAHMAVFSYLPLRDVATGLHFSIQGDFLTGPGRSSVHYDAKWNEWMVDEIRKLVVEVAVPSFLANPEWASTFAPILDTPVTSSDPIFGARLAKPLREAILKQPWYPSEDGSPTSLSEALVIAPEYRDFFSESDLTLLFPGRRVLKSEVRLPADVRYSPKSIERDWDFWEQIRRLAPSKAGEKNAAWFEDVYAQRPPPNGVEGVPILTEDFRVVTHSEVYRLDPGLSLPPALAGRVSLPHKVVLESQWVSSLHQIETTGLARLLSLQTLPQWSGDWATLDGETRLQRIAELFEMWKGDQVQPTDLAFLTLPAINNRWLPPRQLIFPTEYGPSHRLEALAKRGLFDLNFADNVDFLSTEVIERIPTHERSALREFLAELGVEKVLSDNEEKVSQRVGVLCALEHERRAKRSPVELPESFKRGYDIESGGSDPEGKRLRIEAKGSRSSTPDIRLTVNEFRALKRDPDSYFVYVVAKAWDSPELSVIGGDALTDDSLDYGVTIRYPQWSPLRLEAHTFPESPP
jgi:hypothetical protein